MPRPRKPAAERKTHRVQLVITADDRRQWRARASAAGLSLNEYVRTEVNAARATEDPRSVMKRLIAIEKSIQQVKGVLRPAIRTMKADRRGAPRR